MGVHSNESQNIEKLLHHGDMITVTSMKDNHYKFTQLKPIVLNFELY